MSFIKSLTRCKSQHHVHQQQHTLKQVLTSFDLTLLGIGAIIGAGIFIITGKAAADAGPAIILSFMVAALACGFSALAYAELSSSIGGAGSAYSYSYVGLGELVAWLIGWALLMEYSLAITSVAVGWSAYVTSVLAAANINLPHWLCAGPFEHGVINLPAVLIILGMTFLLTVGTQQSAKLNRILVFIKIAVVIFFIVIAAFHVKPVNWHPFAPFGFHGVIAGAAMIFFAFIGFDAISTAAEESVNPQRDLPIGIMTSLAVCTVLYVLVAGLLTGVLNYTELNVDAPVAKALMSLNLNFASAVTSLGAIAGLTTVIMVMFFGLSRIFMAIARDGLLPAVFAKINPKTQTPAKIIMGSGIVMALMAGFVPLQQLAELVNIGTLAAFTLVCFSVLVMRFTKPDMKRPFRSPLGILFPVLGIALNIYLMISLHKFTWICFAIWGAVGLAVYFGYSRKHSLLAKEGVV